MTATTSSISLTARAGRALAASVLAALTLTLAACGGGGSGSLDVAVVVGGRTVDTVNQGGQASTINVPVGQSIELDASEPVVWTLYVGNTSISGNSTVFYGGVEVQVTALTASRVAIDTYSSYALTQSVPITMVATSTYDSAQVATAYIYITN
ncbi:MAG: hypothetical protein AB3X44_19735 [Leptothrix sp. (in: b-proteobacteria)]